jgi:hypothetical protein
VPPQPSLLVWVRVGCRQIMSQDPVLGGLQVR